MASEPSNDPLAFIPPPSDWSARDSLSQLAKLIQARVMRWNYPTKEETDDSDPAEYHSRQHELFYFCFLRPLQNDLGKVDFPRIETWLKVHSQGVAGDVSSRISALAERIPLRESDRYEALLVEMANVSAFLDNVVAALADPKAVGSGQDQSDAEGWPRVDEDRLFVEYGATRIQFTNSREWRIYCALHRERGKHIESEDLWTAAESGDFQQADLHTAISKLRKHIASLPVTIKNSRKKYSLQLDLKADSKNPQRIKE